MAAGQVRRRLQRLAQLPVGHDHLAGGVVGHQQHLAAPPVGDVQVVGKDVAPAAGLPVPLVEADDDRANAERVGKRLGVGLVELGAGAGQARAQFPRLADLLEGPRRREWRAQHGQQRDERLKPKKTHV